MKVKKALLGDMHSFKDEEVENLQAQLLAWYTSNKRKLPWRNLVTQEIDLDTKMYGVWVSEIMLQQTQVATVIDYYTKWMKKWPTHYELAKSSLTEVNEAWSGLGYYSRARRLYEGAQKVVCSMNGKFPRDRNTIMKKLPGVGKYTASAIASIALGEHVGVVDGNVLRVISRLRLIGKNISSQNVVDHMWELADKLTPSGAPGDFNQAMMELGALVCTPKNPSCKTCPVKEFCLAYTKTENNMKDGLKSFVASPKPEPIHDIECVPGCQLCIKKEVWDPKLGVMNFPQKKKKVKAPEKTSLVYIVKHKSSFLMVKRPTKGLLANLWEFPSIPLNDTNQHNEVLTEFCTYFKCELISSDKMVHVGDVLHIFSHIRQTYRIYFFESEDSIKIEVPENYQEYSWWSKEEFENGATSTAMKKVMKCYDSFSSKNGNKHIEKRKLTKSYKPADKKQKTISSFFKAKQ